MPLLTSTYKAPLLLCNGDVNTIAAPFLRRVKHVKYMRERITTPDNDFLDIDWLNSDSKKIALIIHGLEASAKESYMKGMAKALYQSGYEVAAMNLRGCSGELNKQLRAYHSGSTDDIATVIRHILQNHYCDEMVLVGFSLGGNLALKYLGENGIALPSQIRKAMAISVPCDLEATAVHLDKPKNFLYRHRFLKTLKQKALLRIRNRGFPLDENKLSSIKTFRQYDNWFTAPLFGFTDASDYYSQSSSKQFIKRITIPTLILIAKDDPFFTEACFPYKECQDHEKVFLEMPEHGGHVGFILDVPWGNYYSEKRAIEFFS
ncbi:MAG TPA: alpha/beta fold hydrolase [Chitinophagales bacterium]|nr:alpha/beta fold hydrolase [Chitinophagales bacterium]